MALDANMSPASFQKGAAEYPREGQLWAIVAAERTCQVKETWSNIDWLLVDVRLLPFLQEVYTIPWPSWPHVPVVLRLRATPDYTYHSCAPGSKDFTMPSPGWLPGPAAAARGDLGGCLCGKAHSGCYLRGSL